MKKIYTILFIIICSTSGVFSQNWDAMGSGLGSSGQSVKAIAVDPNGNIYAGGTFTGAVSYFAKWNSTNNAWESVGVFDGPVYTISIKTASDIYIGGSFSSAGGVTVHNIARFDGTNFTDIGGGFNGAVRCIYYENSGAGSVYAGGEFSQSGANTMNHISKLNTATSTWTQLGSGLQSVVNSIVVNNFIVYAGTEDLVNCPVSQFDGSTWTHVNGTNSFTTISSGKVFALAVYNNELYAAGEFTQPFPAAVKFVGGDWSSIVTTFSATEKIYCMFVRSGVLYLGGKFANKGLPGNEASNIGRKTTSGFPIQSIALHANQLNDTVFAIGNKVGYVIAGGSFTTHNHVAITNTTIGIDEISSIVTDKKFYPNPVSDKARLVVSTSVKMKNPELQIFDMQSKLLSEINVSAISHQNEVEFSFDCGSLPKGNYYYVLTEEGKNVISDLFIVE